MMPRPCVSMLGGCTEHIFSKAPDCACRGSLNWGKEPRDRNQRSLTDLFPVFAFRVQNSRFPSSHYLFFWATSCNHQLWFS